MPQGTNLVIIQITVWIQNFFTEFFIIVEVLRLGGSLLSPSAFPVGLILRVIKNVFTDILSEVL